MIGDVGSRQGMEASDPMLAVGPIAVTDTASSLWPRAVVTVPCRAIF